MRAWLGALLSVGIVAGLVSGCATQALHERSWVEIDTENFTIWSAQSQRRTLELARDLELFRSIVAFAVGEELPTSPVRTRVYAFDTVYAYRPFSPEEGVVGYFRQSLRDNTIVLGATPTGRTDARQLIQHEYVHFLLENHGGFVYPRWYHEGFAEFLSTAQVKGDKVVLGLPPGQGIKRLWPWIPTGKLLEIEPDAEIDPYAFYSQSWALVHYLNFGRELDPTENTREQLTRYFEARERGVAVAKAVEQSFGVTVDELDADLGRYVRGDRYPRFAIGLENFDPGRTPLVRPLEPARVAIGLGMLSLALERYPKALEYFEEAQRLDPQRVMAQVGMGKAYHGMGKDGAAEAELRAAVERAPDDAMVRLALGNYLRDQAIRSQDQGERSRLADAARREYVTSWKFDDGVPETYARYGSTFLLDGQEPERGLPTLRRAHELLPSSIEIRVDLAQLELATGNAAEARRLALSARSATHDEQGRQQIQQILDRTDPGQAL